MLSILTSSFVPPDLTRLDRQLQEEKVKELFADSSGKEYFHPFTHPDPLDSQKLLRGTALLLDVPKDSPALNQDSEYSQHNAINQVVSHRIPQSSALILTGLKFVCSPPMNPILIQ
jgi:hypothetical protein